VFRKILVPIDETAASMRALDSAIELAEGTRSTLVVMSVVGKSSGWVSSSASGAAYLLEEATKELERERKALLDFALDKIPDSVACMRVLESGDPADRIMHQLESGDYDLVVLGSRGLHGVKASVLGSVSRQVLRDSQAPVMIVHANDEYEDWTPPVAGPDAAVQPDADV
jgi:nucleotide-binding universal stress UspA family protein